MAFTPEEIDDLFISHSFSPSQVARSQELRDAARKLAHLIVNNTKPSADQSAAIRHLRDCLMTANASIALEK